MFNFPMPIAEVWGLIPVSGKRTLCSPNPPYWL